MLKNNVFCTDYGCRTIEQNYECNLIKYNVKFYTKPILSCFLILPLFLDEILMLRILHQLCKVLFTGFLVASHPECAVFFGEMVVRGCARRDLC